MMSRLDNWKCLIASTILLYFALFPIPGRDGYLLRATPSSSEMDLTQGLIGYWKFDEGEGDIAFDSSGNGFHGNIKDGARWVEGKVGKALQFDGANARVEIPHHDALKELQQITLAAWVKLLGPPDQAGGGTLHGILGAGGYSSGYRLLIRGENGTIVFQLTAKDGYNLFSATKIAQGEWYHIAATYDGRKMRVYINGMEDPNEKERTGPIDPNASPVVIGKPQFALNGIIDDVRIYSRALSEEEIQELYEMGQAQEQEGIAVAINEVAWSGTQARAEDEWIELANNTGSEVDLTGWKLLTTDGRLIIELKGSIPPKGFYLLERGDDEVVYAEEDEHGFPQLLHADLIYQGPMLADEGQTLMLLDAEGEIVDTANADGGSWPAGTLRSEEPPNATMERKNPTAPDTDSNWATNDGRTRNGIDRFGFPINGTPRALNSATE